MVQPLVEIRVRNGAELARELRALGASLAHIKNVNHKAGELIAEEARNRAPVDTGALRASIRAGARQDGVRVTAGAYLRQPYAYYQEYGTRYISPRLYMTGAFHAKQAAVLNLYRDEVARLVRTRGRH